MQVTEQTVYLNVLVGNMKKNNIILIYIVKFTLQ